MMERLWLSLTLVVWLSLTAAGAAHAQQDAADQRSTSFQSVQGAVTEDVPGAPLLVAAYALIWLGVGAYVWRIARLQSEGMSQIAELSRQIEARSAGSKTEP